MKTNNYLEIVENIGHSRKIIIYKTPINVIKESDASLSYALFII